MKLRKAKPVGGKSVGLDDLGTGIDIFLMDAGNKFRMLDVLNLMRTFAGPIHVQQSPHGPIAQNGTFLYPLTEVKLHTFLQSSIECRG